jgi:hypothetical protein
MTGLEVSIPIFNQIGNLIMSFINPLIAGLFVVMVFSFSFLFIWLFIKSLILLKLVYNVFRDMWVMYNKNDMGLASYRKIKLNYTYDTEGLNAISEAFGAVLKFP